MKVLQEIVCWRGYRSVRHLSN